MTWDVVGGAGRQAAYLHAWEPVCCDPPSGVDLKLSPDLSYIHIRNPTWGVKERKKGRRSSAPDKNLSPEMDPQSIRT